MKVFIDKPGIDSILKQGNIIEFAFDGKPNNIGIYVGQPTIEVRLQVSIG